MGSGNWYGVSDYAEYLTVYYNKDLFAKYGVAGARPRWRADRRDGQVRQGRRHPVRERGNDYMAMQYLYEIALSQSDPAVGRDYERYTG